MISKKTGSMLETAPHELREKPGKDTLTLLVGSDLHGSRTGLNWWAAQAAALNPDVVVFLGDFITGGPYEFLKEAIFTLRDLAPNVLVVPGNWDPREALMEFDRASFDGFRHLHKSSTFIGGFSFAGLGGSTTTPVGTTPLESSDEGFADPLVPVTPADVWVLHNPVKGFRDVIPTGECVGSVSLRELYDGQEMQPLLVLSGHIHDAAGFETAGPTTFVNPGSMQENRGAWIVLGRDKIDVSLLEG